MEHSLIFSPFDTCCYHWLVALLIVFRALVVDMLEASVRVHVEYSNWNREKEIYVCEGNHLFYSEYVQKNCKDSLPAQEYALSLCSRFGLLL
jgi:hypothetical protein